MGSKNRHAKYLLPIILKNRTPNQVYVEPFCGGCNMIDKVGGERIANDVHFYLIEFFKAVQQNWLPPKQISEELYKDIQHNQKKYNPALVGYVGFNLSYAGKWFGGYARDKAKKRNYGLEAYKNIINQKPNLLDIKFYNLPYWDLQIPANSLIYCDPPYENTTKYKSSFNYIDFWNWCRQLTATGHTVFISEYNAPDDFECLWQREVNNTLVQNTGQKKGIEKLFKLKHHH